MVKKTKQTLGEMLLEKELISSEQWDEIRESARSGQAVSHIIIEKGIMSDTDLADFIAEQMEIVRIDLQHHLVDPKIIDLVPKALALKYKLIPVLKIGQTLTCAMADVSNILVLDEVSRTTGLIIEPAVATEQEINKALDEHYALKGNISEVIKDLDEEILGVKDGEEIELKRLQDMVEDPPVIRLVNMMVVQAIREGASDIHVEPGENSLTIRFRVDGIMYEQSSPPKNFQAAIISRIKILAELDISERRKPQDGRFQMQVDTQKVNIRVSCVPTVYGETVVLRLLNANSVILGLEQIGFNKENLAKYEKLLKKPNGIVLVTGPTGSGKTTTIYASLHALTTPDKNIITIEDPVEYSVEGVRQIQINPDVDLTFANGLRAILRQDPDIIMVGEIRDLETAEIAIQAALTGHLVLATLHTNDAPGAITRLIDMGIEPFLIASTVIGVAAQRLVRVICKECKGSGCHACFNSGYKGRTGIYELMMSDEQVRQATNSRASIDDIRKIAIEGGMKVLSEDGFDKVSEGITSKEEVLRVTQEY